MASKNRQKSFSFLNHLFSTGVFQRCYAIQYIFGTGHRDLASNELRNLAKKSFPLNTLHMKH